MIFYRTSWGLFFLLSISMMVADAHSQNHDNQSEPQVENKPETKSQGMFEALPRATRRVTYEQSVLENQITKEAIEARRKHAEETGVLDGIAAANRQGLTGTIGRAFQEAEFTPVLGWQLPEGIEKRWQEKGIRPEQWELLARAYSDEHLEWLEHLALQNQEDDRTSYVFKPMARFTLKLTDLPVFCFLLLILFLVVRRIRARL